MSFLCSIIGSPYTATITQGILALQEDGVLQKLKIKWWKEHGTAGQCGVSGLTNSNIR